MNKKINSNKFLAQHEMISVLLNGNLGDLNEYFIHSELTNNEIYSDLQFNINHAFLVASKNGSLDKVRYLLNSSNLDIHADINFNNNAAMKEACIRGYEPLVRYFLTSSELQENAKMPENMDYVIGCIIQLAKNGKTLDEQMDYLNFIKFLANDCQIRPTVNIINMLRKETHPSLYEPVIKQLEQNELFHSLQDELSSKSSTGKKIKI